jgi:histidinol phosphatase-like enzyme (inositol monophosphatase family)
MADDCPAAFVDFAGRLADASGVVIKRHFRTRIEVERKTDETPVTIADRESETAMRRLINETWPDHGIIGEEQGSEREDAALVWVLDPIDGTRTFIAGKPMFGTLIALVRDGIPILGVIDQPVLGERWVGGGRRTTFNGAAIGVRPCGALDEAVLNTTSPDLFAGDDAASFQRLSGAVAHTQYGGDCYAYGLLASGFMDLVVEAGLKPHDFCALVPVVEGAGGTITDWQGGALSLSSDGRVIAAADPELHARALERLNGAA